MFIFRKILRTYTMNNPYEHKGVPWTRLKILVELFAKIVDDF